MKFYRSSRVYDEKTDMTTTCEDWCDLPEKPHIGLCMYAVTFCSKLCGPDVWHMAPCSLEANHEGECRNHDQLTLVVSGNKEQIASAVGESKAYELVNELLTTLIKASKEVDPISRNFSVEYLRGYEKGLEDLQKLLMAVAQ